MVAKSLLAPIRTFPPRTNLRSNPPPSANPSYAHVWKSKCRWKNILTWNRFDKCRSFKWWGLRTKNIINAQHQRFFKKSNQQKETRKRNWPFKQLVVRLDVQTSTELNVHDSVFLYFFVVSMRFFFVFSRAARRGEVVGKFEQLMGVWGLWGWLRLVEPDEIYIRNYSRKFGRPARNIKDPGIFPSRLYTVQFESIILLNIQWNFFLNTLPTSVTLLCKVKKGVSREITWDSFSRLDVTNGLCPALLCLFFLVYV